ncbi:transporter substrate-binding domain-containing protein [Oleidesulfovibrio sp.]|uniref:transporter substrate-binding domain-containing protein n=1 Tax=Oleidesulfovibrio sp. TaxID=2909707 RepID=UPI003A878C42
MTDRDSTIVRPADGRTYFGIPPVTVENGQPALTILVGNYAPYIFRDKSGNWSGKEFDLIAAVATQAGVRLRPLEQTHWRRNLRHAAKGEIALIPSVTATPKNQHRYSLLFKTISMGVSLIVDERNKAFAPTKATELITQGKTWGFQEGVYYSAEFHNLIQTSAPFASHFEPVAGFGLNKKKLLGKRISGYLDLEYRCSTPPNLYRIPLPFFDKTGWFLAASDSVPAEIKDRLFNAAALLESAGTLDSIRSKNYCN